MRFSIGAREREIEGDMVKIVEEIRNSYIHVIFFIVVHESRVFACPKVDDNTPNLLSDDLSESQLRDHFRKGSDLIPMPLPFWPT